MLGDVIYVVVLFATILVVWTAIVSFYLLPSIRAFQRGHTKKWPILLINLVLGWTVIGWIATLAWARREPEARNGARGI